MDNCEDPIRSKWLRVWLERKEYKLNENQGETKDNWEEGDRQLY